MKSLKLLGLPLLVVFALGVFAAASASAEEGFLTGGTGTPTTATILGGASVLEGSNKAKLECAKLDDTSIKFSNDKTATGTLHWLECKGFGFAANSKGDESGIILVPVEFLVCLFPRNASGVLVDEFGVAAAIVGIATVEVPALGSKSEFKGLALSAVLTTGSAKLFTVEFTNSSTPGEQVIRECKQGTTTLTQDLLSSTNGGTFELATEGISAGLIQFVANTELMGS